MIDGVYQIDPQIKDYSWGSVSKDSWVAKIAFAHSRQLKTYAEAWYGDHSNGASTYQNKPLDKLNLYPDKLNFLAKVLSIAKPLSIQVHPDEILAKELNSKFPAEFKDPYGKSEGAIALSKLELAHSLVSNKELETRISRFPELSDLLPNKIADTNRALELILKIPKSEVSKICKNIWLRIKNLKEEDLLIKNIKSLELYYPDGDVGVLVLILMNILELRAGEAIYTPTGCPHAYLSGELLEIMKPSDNVIRCGLTDKNIDKDNFLKALKPQNSPVSIGENGKYEFKELLIDIITANRTLHSENKVKIVLSLDASGRFVENKKVVQFNPLSSFLIFSDKTIDIEVDNGRIAIFSHK